MSEINVTAWGRRNRRFGGSDPERTNAFTNSDYGRLLHTTMTLAYSQLKHMYENFTADELRELFIPEMNREALTHTYGLLDDNSTDGRIYLQVMRILPPPVSIFDAPRAVLIPESAILQVAFDRNSIPDGFYTPKPLCGEAHAPVAYLRGEPSPSVRAKFIESMDLLVRITGEWAAVRWVLERLNQSLKTPQQARYVWPAVYALAKASGLQIADELAEPSSRAGNNAIVPSDVMPYLKSTYEVVARSVLLGGSGDMANAYRNGQLKLVNTMYHIGADTVGHKISGP